MSAQQGARVSEEGKEHKISVTDATARPKVYIADLVFYFQAKQSSHPTSAISDDHATN
jgi:hypothetical protein